MAQMAPFKNLGRLNRGLNEWMKEWLVIPRYFKSRYIYEDNIIYMCAAEIKKNERVLVLSEKVRQLLTPLYATSVDFNDIPYVFHFFAQI